MQQYSPKDEEVGKVINYHIYKVGNDNQVVLDFNIGIEKPPEPKRENIFTRFIRWGWIFFKRVIGNPFGDYV